MDLHLHQGSAMWCRPPWRRSKPWNTKASAVPPCTSSRLELWDWRFSAAKSESWQATQRKGVAAGERKARKAGLAEEACWCEGCEISGKDHISLVSVKKLSDCESDVSNASGNGCERRWRRCCQPSLFENNFVSAWQNDQRTLHFVLCRSSRWLRIHSTSAARHPDLLDKPGIGLCVSSPQISTNSPCEERICSNLKLVETQVVCN